MVGTSYDQIAAQFVADRTRFRPKEGEYLALLLDPLQAGCTILDLGCGTGHPIATHIASRGHRIVGVDGSEAMLAIARNHLPDHEWIHDYIDRVDFSERFHGVVCWDALFHLPRARFEPVIRNIHRWLLPGGRVMVSSGGGTGNLPDDGRRFTDTMFGYEFYYDSLSPAGMVAVMEQVGFEVLVSEMCDPPDGARNRGKWATVASRTA